MNMFKKVLLTVLFVPFAIPIAVQANSSSSLKTILKNDDVNSFKAYLGKHTANHCQTLRSVIQYSALNCFKYMNSRGWVSGCVDNPSLTLQHYALTVYGKTHSSNSKQILHTINQITEQWEQNQIGQV